MGRKQPRSIELFAGAGGLGMGVALAGFKHEMVVEWNRQACATLEFNKANKHPLIKTWDIHGCDVRDVNFERYAGLDLLSGGPPCQPFSIGGKHRGAHDHRNMFPEVFRSVRECQPKAVIIENVRGLARTAFRRYLEYIVLQLSHPEVEQKMGEEWESHLSRLERLHTSKRRSGLHYNVVWRVINAADYGIPQRRERVIFVGFRTDLDANWSFPEVTHSQEALLWEQNVSCQYWREHGMDAPLNEREARIRQMLGLSLDSTERWRTVRDAVKGLPDPTEGGVLPPNHFYVPGARSYVGHSGSKLDEPSKTLKAGDHGVPGGENTMVLPNGGVRYYTVREAARLQTFPDDFEFPISWTESMRQLGNAVPVKLAEMLATSIKRKLNAAQS